MGFLDKLLSGTTKDNGSTSTVNHAVDQRKKRLLYSEEEKAERIKVGQEVDMYYIRESRSNNFPYDCFFEWEYKMVEKALKAESSLQGTMDIIMCARDYIINNSRWSETSPLRKFNLAHTEVWIELLLQKAKNKNVYAMAAVSSDYFMSFPEIVGILSNLLEENVRNSYREEIRVLMENNNKEAIVAYAFFLLSRSEDEIQKKNLYLRAGELGSSEAYRELFFSVENNWESEEGLKYAVAAAECDDGEQAFFFQNRLGDAYYYGDGWNISVDKAEGLRWYKRSAANGYRESIRMLEMFRKNGEL